INVRIWRSPFVTAVVWERRHVGGDGLEHDADPIPAHSGPERAVVWTLEVELKAEALAVVGNRSLQVLHDERRPDRREVFVHTFLHPRAALGLHAFYCNRQPTLFQGQRYVYA